jgi:hypothetical protein
MRPVPIMPCIQCITSVDLFLKNQGLNAYVLDEFIYDSLLLSMNHQILIKHTLSSEQNLMYEVKHIQVELLLRIIRGTKLRG